ncbi:MAG: HDOD domain-containing protein [Deltaproteobacteria bacterium]|nr:HDOD domain-containing protein [Deltaproteobacteria bacterium]
MKDQHRAKLLKKIVQGDDLPGLSPLAIRLVELATDDRTGVRDLADIIEKDPALTTRLLRLVGSAFFSLTAQVNSISQAIVLLGFKRVRLMALTLSLRDSFQTDQKDGIDYNQFWKISLYRALIAQNLATTARPVDLNPEEAFVGGLLLGIGQLMLYRASSEFEKAFPKGDEPLENIISWEEKNFGIHHRKVGAVVLRRWRFSDDLVESQRCFGKEALAPDAPTLCKIVELARMATEIVFGQTDSLVELHQMAQTLFLLDKDQLDEIVSSTFDKVEKLGEQLKIEVDSQRDIMAVMEKANLALARLTASLDNSIQGLVAQVRQYDQSLTQISQAAVLGRQETLNNTLDAVAHEIRNPLLSIGGFAERLARHASEKERAQEYAGIIAKESRRLERVLKEIIGYSQAYTPSFSEKDLVSVVNEVIDEFADSFRERNIRVVRDFGDESVEIPMETDGMIKVLRQFINNAAEAMDEDGGKVILSVEQYVSTREVALSISDDGTPVPDAIRSLLLDSNLSEKTFEQGLGFPLARKIIEAHRGRIELGSSERAGNTVRLFLPTCQPKTEA